MGDRAQREPLRIWGRLSSINVRKVAWCAQELGLAFERTDAGGPFGVVQTPAYQALNPNALVPLIEDGDADAQAPGGRFRLWESNVIVRYLCARHSFGGLYPEPLPARFDAERWMDWQQTTLNPAGRAARRVCARSVPPSHASPFSTRTLRRGPSWRASASPWPTSRSAASCTAGSDCRRRCTRGRRGLAWSATSQRCRRGPRRAACSTWRWSDGSPGKRPGDVEIAGSRPPPDRSTGRAPSPG